MCGPACCSAHGSMPHLMRSVTGIDLRVQCSSQRTNNYQRSDVMPRVQLTSELPLIVILRQLMCIAASQVAAGQPGPGMGRRGAVPRQAAGLLVGYPRCEGAGASNALVVVAQSADVLIRQPVARASMAWLICRDNNKNSAICCVDQQGGGHAGLRAASADTPQPGTHASPSATAQQLRPLALQFAARRLSILHFMYYIGSRGMVGPK